MNPKKLSELSFENVEIKRESGYKGVNIFFSVNNQSFHFLIGGDKILLPMSVKHRFKELEVCHMCQTKTYPVPYGHQLCMYFQKNLKELLLYFQKNYYDKFPK